MRESSSSNDNLIQGGATITLRYGLDWIGFQSFQPSLYGLGYRLKKGLSAKFLDLTFQTLLEERMYIART